MPTVSPKTRDRLILLGLTLSFCLFLAGVNAAIEAITR